MYNYNQVMNGVIKYVDNEILDKIQGWQKWVVGAGIGVALNKTSEIFNELKKNVMIKTLGIIDDNDMIDIDTLYREIKKQARKSAVSFSVPMLGTMSLNESDVDKLYNFIKDEE